MLSLNVIEKSFNEMPLPILEPLHSVINTETEDLGHYYRFLYHLVKNWKPKTILELGTWKGTSSCIMATANPEAKVITVDLFPRNLELKVKRDNVEYWENVDSMNDRCAQIKNIDLLFIDTEHNGRCLYEFEFFRKNLSDVCIVLFDDINLNKEMKAFWVEFHPEGFEKAELQIHGEAGFGLICRGLGVLEKEHKC